MSTPGKGSDLDWVRKNGVHRILDSLARDIILRRPTDVLHHIIAWAERELGAKEEASSPSPQVPNYRTPLNGKPEGNPFATPSAVASQANGGGEGGGTPRSRGEGRAETAGTPPGPPEQEEPLLVQHADSRSGMPSRRSTRRASQQGERASEISEPPATIGERRRTPPTSRCDNSIVQSDMDGEAPPEIDDAPHQHKWDNTQPVEWRPSPDQLSERYKNPRGLLTFVKEIDSGHYGRVYEAVRKSDGTRLAVKKIPIEGDWVELEVQNLAHCSCEWVVKLVETYYSPEEDRLWIAMEKLGPSLAMVAEAAGEKAFSEACIASILRQIFCALKEVHGRQRVHLDVKPGNLLVGADGNLRLADFGTMQNIGDKCEQLGDFAFMAPEVAYSVGAYMGESDIWSCGITILYLADGEAPLAEKPEWLIYIHRETCMTPRLWNPDEYSNEVSDLLGRCFMKEAAKRPTAVEALDHPWIKRFANEKLVLPPPLNRVL